jgi:hypothetical protein
VSRTAISFAARAAGFDVLLTADRLLAASPRAWSPLGCVYVTSNAAARLRNAADQIEAACLAVLPGQMLTVQI